MNELQDKWVKAISYCDFKESENPNRDYEMFDGTWRYYLNFEGYAYILYMEYRDIEVPIAHFRDEEKFKIFVELLTVKFDQD